MFTFKKYLNVEKLYTTIDNLTSYSKIEFVILYVAYIAFNFVQNFMRINTCEI